MREINMPKMGLNMQEGIIVKWLVDEGEVFHAGDPLCEIESEKTTNEYTVDFDGKLIRILIKAGESAPVGKAIAIADDI